MNNLEKQIQSGKINGHVLFCIRKMVKAGATGLEIDKFAYSEIARLGGTPAFLGFNGYKFTSCISINETLVHGIPNNNPFNPGDIVSVDMGVNYQGWLTDAAMTVVVEPASDNLKKLIQATDEALLAGIDQARPGNRVGDISWTVQGIAEKYRFGIAKDLAGHGISTTMHEPPTILNYGVPGKGELLKEGMAIAIEPMFSLYPDKGSKNKTSIFLEEDGWSIGLVEGNMGSHSEHTVIITKDKPLILTSIVDIGEKL